MRSKKLGSKGILIHTHLPSSGSITGCDNNSDTRNGPVRSLCKKGVEKKALLILISTMWVWTLYFLSVKFLYSVTCFCFSSSFFCLTSKLSCAS